MSGRKQVYMHRVIMGNPPGKEIDHINHNGLDNRKRNLRICQHRENLRAMKSMLTRNAEWNFMPWTFPRGLFIQRLSTLTG